MTYGAAAIILGPAIFFTRQYSVPVILWIFEICVYSLMMHVVIHYFVKITVWFQSSTQMERALDRDKVVETWGTPLVEFWDRSLYDPSWIFYVECVFVIGFTVLVFKMRPFKTQKVKPKNIPKPGQPGYKPGSRPTQSGIRKR